MHFVRFESREYHIESYEQNFVFVSRPYRGESWYFISDVFVELVVLITLYAIWRLESQKINVQRG